MFEMFWTPWCTRSISRISLFIFFTPILSSCKVASDPWEIIDLGSVLGDEVLDIWSCVGRWDASCNDEPKLGDGENDFSSACSRELLFLYEELGSLSNTSFGNFECSSIYANSAFGCSFKFFVIFSSTGATSFLALDFTVELRIELFSLLVTIRLKHPSKYFFDLFLRLIPSNASFAFNYKSYFIY